MTDSGVFRSWETVLRNCWNEMGEKRYPEYRASVAGLNMTELEMEKEQWLDRLGCLSLKEYQGILAEAAGLTPVNDNEWELER